MKLSSSSIIFFLLAALAVAAVGAIKNEEPQPRKLKKNKKESYYAFDNYDDLPKYKSPDRDQVSKYSPETYKNPAPAPAPTSSKNTGYYSQSRCPSAITLTYTSAGRVGDKCLRGAACQTRFDPDRPTTNNLVGSDILSVKGQQQAFLAKHGLTSFIQTSQQTALLDKVYTGAIMKCLTRGPNAVYYDFQLNTVPYQQELYDLCNCILSGGINCDKTCNCYQGVSRPVLPFGLVFCDCYCACC